MAVVKSLDKIYLLKNTAIPEFYLGGNEEFLGESWKNQGIGLALSSRTSIQNFTPKFKSLFGKNLSPSMSEGFHSEIDDARLYTEEVSNLSINICLVVVSG